MSQDDKKPGTSDKYILIFDDGVEQLSDVSVSPNTEWYSQSDFKKKKLVSCIRLIEYSAYLALEKERDRWKDAADDYKSASRIAIEAGNQLIAERDKWREWAAKLAAASERLLARIDVNGGIGEYKGGPAFVIEPLITALAEFQKEMGK